MIFLGIILSAACAYLIGSLNFAIIISKMVSGRDIREYGSKNAGATNVLRILGKRAAIIAAAGDFVKGILSILLGRLLFLWLIGGFSPYLDYAAAIGALLGHLFPLYHGFKGGKGVLVSAGSLLMIDYRLFLGMLAVWVTVVMISKIVSVSSISAAVSLPVFVIIFCVADKSAWIAPFFLNLLMALVVVYMHRENIGRLIKGKEKKLFTKKK